MHSKRIFICLALGVAIGLFGCTKEKAVEAPKRESVTKNLVPSKAGVKAESFVVELSNLQIAMMVNPSSKEVVETPSLRGRYQVTNTSKDILDVQGVTLEYMDQAGKIIAFQSGEKIAKASLFLHALKPGEVAEGSLDVTIPKAAVKELAKIDINVVYIPTPLRRETVALSEKVE
jgi:hypothetical protein